ncbi:uncharacterized protein MYCFIDRAFT_198389 [Pseudocercospora fijiensis CIRAD86]|uniref:RING-type domain-containing protein n=1 Tax=Pseudocercospora fijiensis (strain CIRAD86) TaxID=383855 RepID=M3ASB4_PSEFD|nr:uncharacterized protein MYCFIDRAFT_198389 [Pseudocercospora fijiensis CIRAD86]EME80048.1 hypothetical protein MYCFIDRAFT_198389 [Pseudocercospora fijiensis CIRAD86]
MTPEQSAAIAAANANDVLLISHAIGPRIGPESITRHGYRLVLADRFYRETLPGPRTTAIVRPVNSLLPHDWVMYRRFGKDYWRNHNRGKTSISIVKLLDEHSYIDVRPSDETIFQRLLHGICPYEACRKGLVPLNEYSARVLRSFREPVQNRDITRGNTICAICMGTRIYREHEEQVARFVARPVEFDHTDYQVHIHRVNDRRRELLYEPISENTSPTHLTVPPTLPGISLDLSQLTLSDTTHRNPDSEGAGSPRPAAASETAQAGPSSAVIRFLSQYSSNSAISPVIQPGYAKPTSVKPYFFYKKAAERVLDNECQVCHESFEEGGLIAELPCWHFFHAECFQKWLLRKCPLRCNADTVPP